MISIIIPAYNSATTLPRCLDSVLAQTWRDLEILVVDDGSTDSTRQILSQYGPPVRYLYQENQERSAARNAGMRHATGDFIAFLDADDTWLPHKLARQMQAFQDDPQLDLVYAQAYLMDENGTRLGITGSYPPLEDHETFYCRLLLGNLIPSPTPVVRRSRCNAVEGFDPALRQGEDWDYWLRLVKDARVAIVSEPLACHYICSREDHLHKMSARQVHTAYQHIIDKARLDPVCSPARINMALALIQLDSAVIEIGLGHGEAGQFFLDRSLQSEPELLTTHANLAVMRLVNLILQAFPDFYSVGASVRLASRFWEPLPHTAHYRQLRRKTIGQIYASYFFRAAQLGNAANLVRATLPMLVYDPSMARNRGVWSFLLRAFLPGNKT